MRILLTLAFSLSLLSLSAQKLSHKITSDEGKFKVAFPMQPTEQEKDVSGFNTVIYLCNYNGTVYLLSYSNIPASESEAIVLMQETRKGFSNSIGMQITEEKDIKKGKIPGLYTEGFSKEKNLFVKYEIYYIKDILYQLVIMKPDNMPEKNIMKAFSKSFKIIK